MLCLLILCLISRMILAARHLADYVLIWGGGGGDDLGECFFVLFRELGNPLVPRRTPC